MTTKQDTFTQAQLEHVADEAAMVISEHLCLQDSVQVSGVHINLVLMKVARTLKTTFPLPPLEHNAMIGVGEDQIDDWLELYFPGQKVDQDKWCLICIYDTQCNPYRYLVPVWAHDDLGQETTIIDYTFYDEDGFGRYTNGH